jgi:hypothetical protein
MLDFGCCCAHLYFIGYECQVCEGSVFEYIRIRKKQGTRTRVQAVDDPRFGSLDEPDRLDLFYLGENGCPTCFLLSHHMLRLKVLLWWVASLSFRNVVPHCRADNTVGCERSCPFPTVI